MAAPAVSRSSGPLLCSSFAEVCSFLERYGAALDLPDMTFPQMERYLRDTTAVPKPLVELHVKLLRKLGRTVTTDKWERYLAKVCQELNSTWAWELEQKGYQEMSMECKSSILKYLCECQFDDNLKFKTAVNDEEPEKMRLQPIGRDRQGLMYWIQRDRDQNIRLYTEEQDDLDGSSWKCIVRTRNDLAEALELLKAQVELNHKLDQNQSESRSSSPAQKDTGDECEPSGTKEEPDRKTVVPGNEQAVKVEQIKQEVVEVKKEKMELPPSGFDNRVSTITSVAPTNAVSVVMAPSVVKQEAIRGGEAERAVVRSNQQAKIPLKKRELKLTESFHSNHLNNNNNNSSSSSSIIVCNPSVIQSQESKPAAPLPAGVVTVTCPDLTNGRVSVLLQHKDGQNGVIEQVGHVGVIRSHRAEPPEHNGPTTLAAIAKEEEVSRQSVLVRKDSHQSEHTAPKEQENSSTPEGGGVRGEMVEEEEKESKDSSAPHKDEEQEACEVKKDEKQEVCDATDASEKKDECVNGGSAAEVKDRRREEASSEIQKEGIRLKIKIPPHRRNKRRGKAGRAEEKEKETQEDEEEEVKEEEGRRLRRSSRIGRSFPATTSRPCSKTSETKKTQKKAREESEDGDEAEEQSSPTKKDRKVLPVGPIRKRRGRRRRKHKLWSNIRVKKRRPNEEEEEPKGGSESEGSWKSEELPSEDACSHCGLPNHPELILLCDSCDSGYHTACLRPPLMLIPDGQWFCPPCQHKLLCEKLEEQLQSLDSALKKRERAERRRERLVYVGISVENIIPEGDEEEEEEEKSTKKKDPKKNKNLGRRSTRTRKHISYRFDDFDDAIDEAIEDDLSGENATVLPEDAKDGRRPIRTKTVSARNRKRRRLNDLESDSTVVESEDEFMLSNSSENEELGADEDQDDEDEDAGSEVGSPDRRPRPQRHKPGRMPQRARKHVRRRRRRQRSSEEEEGETEEELDTDQLSDLSDSDSDGKRRGLRRGQRQQVNYREESESSDVSASAPRDTEKQRKPRRERLSSDYSDASLSSRESEEDEDERRRVRRRRGEQDEIRLEKRRRREDVKDKWRLKRRCREEGEEQRMGRGRRREILSQRRRQRLAQMLKKRRPSTDEEEEESEEESDSSEEDRPIRKRLNRIDSDDDDEEDEESSAEKATSRSPTPSEKQQHRTSEKLQDVCNAPLTDS
ncbi:remodeling and spacing factor 1 isoform X1 [Gouania willdenowi]|uniref:PHD-type domain-containing protein n=2 Tax=Gouania willdenowi TaxID=441366 RepID=A0A8C5DQ42_GOUWI|nr:remodeling and spacing factor 1 isoform X1 [Gouania willdenowi]